MTEPPFRARRPFNFPLWIGALLTCLVAAVAVWGPAWAPRDPMQTNPILEFDGVWVAAPFPPFQYEGFPLGSDANGRDILSQVLWAVRPTMIMVTIVALVRLVVGVVIGLAAGWLTGKTGSFLNSLVAAAVSAPTLITALAVIAAVGIDLGVTAFILGLAATGWAETARLISDLTRRIRSMEFIEAARSLGQSNFGLIRQHVWRQVTPMLSMLAAFEISSTLLTAAALGFLGYYIGGEVWVAVTDTSSVRTTGMPELGLMVATLSTDIFAGPYKMVAAASLIFLTILGFNLLGEGLRLRMERGRPRTSAWRLRLEQAALDFDQYYLHPLATLLRTNRLVSGGLAVVLVSLLAGLGWLIWKPVEAGVISAALEVPGGHLWASQFHNPFGTRQTPALGPHSLPVVLWTKPIEGSFTGGPAVAADGTLYLTTADGRMLTYTSAGQTTWPANLLAEPVGSPALSAQGRVYVADISGGLTAISPLGDILWRMDPGGGAPATSGPVVDGDGIIYYMRAGQVQAVSSQGSALWLSQARNLRTGSPPALSPDGSLLFVLEAVLRRADGVKLDLLADADTDQFFSGADGKLYVRSRFALEEWQYGNGQAEIAARLDWDYQLYGLISPPNQVGADASSNIWMLYFSGFEDGHFIWVDRSGNVTGDVRFPHRETSVIGLDGDGVAYICGTSRITGKAECLALQPGLDEPLWTLELPFGAAVTGGAITPGRLYVATEEGYLMALGGE